MTEAEKWKARAQEVVDKWDGRWKSLVEAIAAAQAEAYEAGREDVAGALTDVADQMLHDQKSDGVDGHVSAVLRGIAIEIRKQKP